MKQITLPVKFDREKYSLEDLEIYCSCGHFVNEHDGGLGGGDSICEVENCGCVSCEFDYEFSVTMNYFQGHYDNWQINRISADTKKRWAMMTGGLPAFKEPYQMTIILEKEGDAD